MDISINSPKNISAEEIKSINNKNKEKEKNES